MNLRDSITAAGVEPGDTLPPEHAKAILKTCRSDPVLQGLWKIIDGSFWGPEIENLLLMGILRDIEVAQGVAEDYGEE